MLHMGNHIDNIIAIRAVKREGLCTFTELIEQDIDTFLFTDGSCSSVRRLICRDGVIA